MRGTNISSDNFFLKVPWPSIKLLCMVFNKQSLLNLTLAKKHFSWKTLSFCNGLWDKDTTDCRASMWKCLLHLVVLKFASAVTKLFEKKFHKKNCGLVFLRAISKSPKSASGPIAHRKVISYQKLKDFWDIKIACPGKCVNIAFTIFQSFAFKCFCWLVKINWKLA